MAMSPRSWQNSECHNRLIPLNNFSNGLLASALLAFGFFLFAQSAPNHAFPDWARLDLVAPETFEATYQVYFVKDRLPPPRLLNLTVFFITLYALLTYLWVPINRAFGWFLIPIGEASLYVFLMHVVFIAAIDQLPGYFDSIPTHDAVWPWTIWVNTALYLGIIFGLWFMVRHRVLFAIVPR